MLNKELLQLYQQHAIDEERIEELEDLVAAKQSEIDALRKLIPPAAPAPVVRLTDAQKQHIHDETGAGHALICLVESYIHGIGGGNG